MEEKNLVHIEDVIDGVTSARAKIYRVRNILTQEYPLFGVWEMVWEYKGSNASYEVNTQ